jgi:hypothetical protein
MLATVGVLLKVDATFGDRLDRLTQWNGEPVSEALRVRLAREWQKVALMTTQIHDLEGARRATIRQSQDEAAKLVRQLLQLRGIGDSAAWLYVMEFIAWREFRNRRPVGGSTGLAGTPYKSGGLDHEQGISKAGNRRVPAMAVQTARRWLTHQPQSALTQWYNRRFANGGPVARKIGIVAVARRLVIDLALPGRQRHSRRCGLERALDRAQRRVTEQTRCNDTRAHGHGYSRRRAIAFVDRHSGLAAVAGSIGSSRSNAGASTPRPWAGRA